jgi:hypothetical protein
VCASLLALACGAGNPPAAPPDPRAAALHRDAIVIDGHNDVGIWILDSGFDLGMDGADPAKRSPIGAVRGLGGQDGALIGIDYRIQDGELYGVGNGGGSYRLDPFTGDATFVSQLGVALDGTQFGVDFNPAADRLRSVSDTGQNLRHDLNPGGTTTVDAALNNQGPVALGISAAAYTNNDLDPNSATTLFDVDATLDQLAIQSPPNNGVRAPTGKLGLDAGAPNGFDIYSVRRGGVSVQNHGFAALPVNGIVVFHRVDLLTGRAQAIGALGAELVEIALPLDQ